MLFITSVVIIQLINQLLASQATYIPDVQFEVLNSGKFRAYIPDFPGMNYFALQANINTPFLQLNEPGSISGEATKAVGHFRIIEFMEQLRIGDKIYYWLFISQKPFGYTKHGLVFYVTDIKDCYAPLQNNTAQTSVLIDVRSNFK